MKNDLDSRNVSLFRERTEKAFVVLRYGVSGNVWKLWNNVCVVLLGLDLSQNLC